MDYRTAPREVLVMASGTGICGIDAADGTELWQHTRARGWPLEVVAPRIARVDAEVVVACGLQTIVWVRVQDGAILGSDKLWFDIDQVVAHGSTLVVRGSLGLVSYRNGARAWGVRYVAPAGAILDIGRPWITDAAGNPTRPATMFEAGAAAMLLGDAVTQIDKTT